MLRIAILEKEQCAKDIIFECAKLLKEMEWTFAHFTRISEFAKADNQQKFDILIMNEVFHTQRVHTSFVADQPRRIVLYCMEQLNQEDGQSIQGRIMFINRHQIKTEMQRIEEHLLLLLRSHKEYLLSCNNVLIPLRMQDIYYIEKHEKNLFYYTAKGMFRERKTMAQAEQYFSAFDFLRIHASYLVNMNHITGIVNEGVALDIKEVLPIARARKKEIIEVYHTYIKRNG